MSVRVLLLCACFLMSGFAASFAAAQESTPAKIQEAYSQYKQALADGQVRSAASFAKYAWDLSEETSGASKLSGDLAYNYAEIKRAVHKGSRNKAAEKAYERSLELSRFNGDDAGRTKLQRQVSYGRYFLQIKKTKKAKNMFARAENTARENALSSTEDYARLQYENSVLAFKADDYEDARRFGEAATDIYSKLGKLATSKGYKALYLQSEAQYKTGAYLSAYEGFKTVFTNTEGVLRRSDPVIGRSYRKAVQARYAHIKDIGSDRETYFLNSSEPTYWPNYDEKFTKLSLKAKAYKFDRVPPTMPRNAKSSGFVAVVYDTDNEGKPINLRIVQRSHLSTFDKAATDAIRLWKGRHRDTGQPARNVKDIPTVMTFLLSDERGRILDYYGRPIEK